MVVDVGAMREKSVDCRRVGGNASMWGERMWKRKMGKARGRNVGGKGKKENGLGAGGEWLFF